MVDVISIGYKGKRVLSRVDDSVANTLFSSKRKALFTYKYLKKCQKKDKRYQKINLNAFKSSLKKII